jgi:hypothetical protein
LVIANGLSPPIQNEPAVMPHHRRFRSWWPYWPLEPAVMCLITVGSCYKPLVMVAVIILYSTKPQLFLLPTTFLLQPDGHTSLSSIVAAGFCLNFHETSPLLMYCLHQLVLWLVTINPLAFYPFSLD